tara:strand:+ start:943 stop:2025 length:1083 start_codon:yes stop_codon:yes gene_type:complete
MSKHFKNFLKKKMIFESWNGMWIEYWLTPNGKIERATEGHYTWAEQRGILDIPNEMWNDREYVYLCMAKKGYVRVVKTTVEIFFQKYIKALDQKFVVHLNRLQRSALISFGMETHKVVIGTGEPDDRDEDVYLPGDFLTENTVVGVSEPVEINGIGAVIAKVDSGNDGYNVIHGINIQRLKNDKGEIIIKFQTINGQTVSFRQIGWVEVVAGGRSHNRPVIGLGLKIKNKFFENEPFSVADRSQNDEKILLGVPFIKKLDAIIDVNKAEVVSEIHSESQERIINAHNDRIDKEIESLRKDIVNTEAERDYAMEYKGEGWKVYNDRIDNLQKEISRLEGQKLVHAAISKSRFGEIRRNLES